MRGAYRCCQGCHEPAEWVLVKEAGSDALAIVRVTVECVDDFMLFTPPATVPSGLDHVVRVGSSVCDGKRVVKTTVGVPRTAELIGHHRCAICYVYELLYEDESFADVPQPHQQEVVFHAE